MANELVEGKTAPDFSLINDEYDDVSISDYRGQNVVLYFYPKDDTPGCTQEAIDFSSLKDDFAAADTVIMGMSKDDVESHEHFKQMKKLNIMLLADPDLEALPKYGVWVEKNMYGKKYMGIQRSTFLINKEGVIAKIWKKVKVKGHAEEVLKAAEEL